MSSRSSLTSSHAAGKYADDKPKPSGSGLGLAIAKHVVEHCQGKIWAESPAGQGATFRVFIPGEMMEAIDPVKPGVTDQ